MWRSENISRKSSITVISDMLDFINLVVVCAYIFILRISLKCLWLNLSHLSLVAHSPGFTLLTHGSLRHRNQRPSSPLTPDRDTAETPAWDTTGSTPGTQLTLRWQTTLTSGCWRFLRGLILLPHWGFCWPYMIFPPILACKIPTEEDFLPQ